MLIGFAQLRLAVRSLARRPAFTAVVLVTLALGIGANAAIFSVVRGVLLRPLPWRQPERIFELSHEEPYLSVSEEEFRDYRRDLPGVERLAAINGTTVTLAGDGDAERVEVALVSSDFFPALGVAPLLGRPIGPDDDRPHQSSVLVISHGLWQRRFGGDPHVVGKELRIGSVTRPVIGVMPEGFDYPSRDVDIWIPLRLNYDSLDTRNNHSYRIVGRLAPGATVARVTAAARSLGQRWLAEYPSIYAPGKPPVARVVPVGEALLGRTRPYLLALLGAVSFVLLIACVNVANLLLARGEARRKELAVRAALGASARRLVGELMAESLVLAATGGALGLLLAWAGVRALVAGAPDEIPRLADVRVDAAVVAFTAAATLLTALLFGLAPAVRASRGHSARTLRDGTRTATAHAGVRRLRRALVVSEVALAVVLLAGAGLLVRTLVALHGTDLGFDPSRLLTFQVTLPATGYSDERSDVFFGQLVERLHALPSVRDVAAASRLPLAEGYDGWSILVDGRVVKQISQMPFAAPQPVTPGFFRTMGIRIVGGRPFTDADRAGAAPVTIVSEAMARQLWPGQSPIGHTIRMPDDRWPWVTVVGVAHDVRMGGVRGEVPAIMYFPYAQAGRVAYGTPRTMTVLVRAADDPTALSAAARAAVRALDPAVPVTRMRTMERVVDLSIARERFTTSLLASFATLALVLAGVGIYGVIAYAVTQRRYEIGVRIALGAQARSVLGLVLGEGLWMAAVGAAIGLAGAVGLARVVRSLLVDVSPTDLPTLLAASTLLLAVAALASLLPARRAMAVSPTEALRGG